MTLPENDAERLTILNESSVVDQYLTTAPHTVSHLRAAIDHEVEDGIRAARYDGDPGKGSSIDGTPTEVAALGHHHEKCPRFANGDQDCTCGAKRSDKAVEDQHDLDRYLAMKREATKGLRSLLHYLAPSRHGGKAPGHSPCPQGRCVAHWRAGISTAAVRNPQRKRCSRCHTFNTTHGEDYPELVLRAVSDLGGSSGPLGQEVWNHPLVNRAWDSSGWVTKPVLAKRTA